MKNRKFYVTIDNMVDFCEVIESNELSNEIVGVSENEEIIIEVSYDSSERSAIFELIEITDNDDV
ncbi:MAG: hypothetical protein WCQ95_00335 [Bacteroidota bacterium]